MTKFLIQWVCASFGKLLRYLILTWLELGAWVPLFRTQSFLLLFSQFFFPGNPSHSPDVSQESDLDRRVRSFCSSRGNGHSSYPCRCATSLLCQSHCLLPARGVCPEGMLCLDVYVSPMYPPVSTSRLMCGRKRVTQYLHQCLALVDCEAVTYVLMTWDLKHPFLKFNELPSLWWLLPWGLASYLLFVYSLFWWSPRPCDITPCHVKWKCNNAAVAVNQGN